MSRGMPAGFWSRWSARRATNLLVSTLGTDARGGIYFKEAAGFAALDEVSCTGLAVSSNRRFLARLLWAARDSDVPGRYVIYDHGGVVARRTLDDLREPHSALWVGTTLMAVSTGTNEILWIGRSGSIDRRWHAPGEGDCWHLNSLGWHGRRVIASAFGRFTERHGWVEPAARRGTGVVIEIPSGRDVLTGLSSPHNPIRIEDGWLICDSANGLVLRLDRNGRTLRQVGFDGWTRGLAYDEDNIYVGVSAHRLRGEEAGTAFVATVSRDRFEEVERSNLPTREIYDVMMVPEPLLDAVRHSPIRNP